MSSNDPHVDMHRWYVIVYFGDEFMWAFASTADGIRKFDSSEELAVWLDGG